MENPENLPRLDDDIIVIRGRSDTDFWCQRFSVSPFTLFHLLKTVGNSASQIGEFLHSHQGDEAEKAREPAKNISIL